MQLEDVTLGFFRLILKIVSRLIALSSSIEAQQSSLIETNQTLYRSKSSKCRICFKLWSLVDTDHLNMPDFHTQIHALLTKMSNNNRNCPVKSLEFLILTLLLFYKPTRTDTELQQCSLCSGFLRGKLTDEWILFFILLLSATFFQIQNIPRPRS